MRTIRPSSQGSTHPRKRHMPSPHVRYPLSRPYEPHKTKNNFCRKHGITSNHNLYDFFVTLPCFSAFVNFHIAKIDIAGFCSTWTTLDASFSFRNYVASRFITHYYGTIFRGNNCFSALMLYRSYIINLNFCPIPSAKVYKTRSWVRRRSSILC